MGRDLEVKVRRRVALKEGEETAVELGKDLGSLVLRGRLSMEGNPSLWAEVTVRPAAGEGEELSLRTYKERGWAFAFPFLRPGRYAVEVEHWVEAERGRCPRDDRHRGRPGAGPRRPAARIGSVRGFVLQAGTAGDRSEAGRRR